MKNGAVSQNLLKFNIKITIQTRKGGTIQQIQTETRLDKLEEYYCTFHKHANSKVQGRLELRFSLPSIIITITSKEPWNTETHKTDRNAPITNHEPWPFEPVKVKFCFLGGSSRWLTAVSQSVVSWLLNFRIRMFVKSTLKGIAIGQTVLKVQFCCISNVWYVLVWHIYPTWSLYYRFLKFHSEYGLFIGRGPTTWPANNCQQ